MLAECQRLRSRGMTEKEIGEEVGIGEKSVEYVFRKIREGEKNCTRPPAPQPGENLRAFA